MRKITTLLFILAAFSFLNAQTTSVTFQVDMSIQEQLGNFVPAEDSVYLRGSMNGWGQDLMTDVGDYVYEVTLDTFAVNDTLFFKFFYGADTWENDPNRELVVLGDSTAMYFWNDVSEIGAEISLTFEADMEFEIVSGRFDPENDTLTVRGSFNGWSGEDIMAPSVADPNKYQFTSNYGATLDEEINYKFAYITPGGTVWENDPNKILTITQSDIDAGFAFDSRVFNNATLETVTNQETTILFEVDMNGAVDANGTAFPSIDNVFVAGANVPLTWPQGGWPDEDSSVVIFLNDDGVDGDLTAGDGFWSKNITFPQYTILTIQYKYGANWGLASNNGTNDNESSIGTDHFLTFTPDLVSAKVENVFGAMGNHDLVEVVTDVKEVSSVPAQYSLSQNYPNPFNPSTTIEFSLPASSNVELKIFNLLGQEVAQLLNEEFEAGTYNVNFNAQNLSSGIYFYTINAENFSSTKKMILMK